MNLSVENESLPILNSLSTVVIVLKPDDTVGFMNVAARSLLSTQKQGHPLSSDLMISETDDQPQKSLLNYIEHSRQSSKDYAYRQVILHIPEQTPKIIDCCFSLLEGEIHNTILIEIIIADRISQITRESILFDQYSAAHQIAKGLAHEINNPLSGIRGAAQLLEKTLSNSNQTECTQIIINETSRLQTLIKRMLGPSHLPNIRELNIHDLVEHVKFLVDNETSTHIQIERDYDPSIPHLSADRDQLIQAILNLVRNAIQALQDQGTIILRTRTARNVTIAKKIHKLALKLDVIDNGPGIPQNLQDRIFLPMIKNKPEGSGLGLSIAQSLVTQNHGHISFESLPGNTVFSIYLPINLEPTKTA